MKPLWGGRFRGDNDPAFKSFNASFGFDRRLLPDELAASEAYSLGLARAGVLTTEEQIELAKGLAQIATDSATDPCYTDAAHANGCEDVHTFVEGRLFEICGSVAHKIHTGRSRNEQTATNLRLFTRRTVNNIVGLVDGLVSSLTAHATKHAALIMPGYTHLQRAQPLLWSHYIGAYAEQLGRDRRRFVNVAAAADACPLGSGAIAGNSFGLDRAFIARQLGFSTPTANSLDATSDRDFVVDFLHAASLAMVHMSRMAEDMIIFSTHEFSFIELGDEVTTGSSLMPQKKNPDALELIRGKSGRVFGHLIGLLSTLKALPSGYNKDLQEDKEALFDAADTVAAALRVMTTVIATMQPNAQAMGAAAASGFLNATDLAEYLVKKGLPFRIAHEIVGKVVLVAQDSKRTLLEMELGALRLFSPLIEEDVYHALTPAASIAIRLTTGSPESLSRL